MIILWHTKHSVGKKVDERTEHVSISYGFFKATGRGICYKSKIFHNEKLCSMKYLVLKVILIVTLGFSVCTATPLVPQETAESVQATSASVMVEDPTHNKTMGEFVIASARFVDEVNGEKPGPGEKLLLIELTRPGMESLDPGDFSLEEFQAILQDTTQGMIHILGEDGSETISSMAGWVVPEYKEFAMGFRLTSSVSSYQLIWPGNNPIIIIPIE